MFEALYSSRERNHEIIVSTGSFFLALTTLVLPLSVTASVVTYSLASLLGILAFAFHPTPRQFIRHPLVMSFIIMFLLFFLGLSYTVATHHEAFTDMMKHRWILLTPFMFLLITHEKDRDRMLSFFLLGVCITLLFSYIKWFGWITIPDLSYRNKAGVFFDHITQNYFFSFGACICALRFLRSTHHRWLNGLIFLLISYNVLFMSTGRTGYILYAIFMTYLFYYHFGKKGLLIALGIVSVLFIAAYLLSPIFHQRIVVSIKNIQHYSQGQTKTSLGLKFAMWKNAITLIQQKPWLGYGTGGIKQAFLTLPKEAQALSGINAYVETAYLNILLEFGLIGFLVFCIFIFLQWHYSKQLSHDNKFIIRAFLLSFLIGCIANPFLIAHGEMFLYSLVLITTMSELCAKSVIDGG